MALSACACVALRACVRAWVTSYHLPLSPNLYPFTRAGRSAAVSVFVSAAKSSVAHIPCALSLLHTRSSQLFASQQNLKSAWLAQVPSVPPPSPGDVVVRLRRHLQSQCRNNIYAPYSRRLQDEQFTEVDSLTGSRQRRCCSFLLDPMICEAILGKNSRMYPPCPDAKEWDAKGVSIDAASLVKAIKDVLYAGTVLVSKDSVYRGKHGNLCFSQEVHDRIVQNLDTSLVVKIRDFLNEGERLEHQILYDSEPSIKDRGSSTVSTFCSIGSACSFKRRSDSRENARLRIENACLKNQLSVQGQAQLSQRRLQHKGNELERKDSSKTLTESAEIETMEKELEKAKRDLRRCQYSASKPNQFFLGGKVRTGVPVNNLVFHPRTDREPGEKGKQLPTLCNESVVVVIHGSKEHRPGGGWRYTVKAKLNEFNI